MTHKTITRTAFAKLAGCHQSTVTRACLTALLPACNGKRIDPDHPAAIDYLAVRACGKTPPPATGIDPKYEEALQLCQNTGRWTASNMQRKLMIGYKRAKRILEQFEGLGLVPAPEPQPPEPDRSRSHTAAAALPPPAEIPPSDPPPVHELPKDVATYMDWTMRDIITQFGTMTSFNDFLKATKTVADIVEKDLKNAKSRGELVSRHAVKVGVIDPIEAAHINLLTDGAKSMATRAKALCAAGQGIDDVEKYLAKAMGKFIKPVKSKVARAMANA